ncbi:S24 family peptidase [Aeromonas caviae]|uniref:XRE family transcriptional regulator n=1 Tax=Aeromonas caviae TaxID=648 RepID=UPI0029DBA348|nr:S24 family peptidase [Aeromonas caviae]MDX7814419.1 S24 family peptidase [Aeromonas caviae]
MTYDEKEQKQEKENSVPLPGIGKGTGFSERLLSLIGHGNGRKFSRETGISYSKLHNYLSGVSLPTLDSLVTLAEATGASIEWLATGKDEAGFIREAGANYNPTESFTDEFALIPGYPVQVSAGHGALTQGELEPSRHLAFRRKWLRWRGFDEKELAIVWSKGDSMEPTISNNDTLVVHLGRTRPVDGHIYVVRNDDQLWVKRLQVRPDAWVLISDNAIYPPMTIPKDEQHTFEVIGQVVHIAHDVGE